MLLIVFNVVFILGCIDRGFAEERQEEKEGTTNTFILEKEERKKEG